MSFRKGTARTVLPFGLDYSDVLSTNHDIEKPKIILPINAPFTEREKSEARQSINFAKITLDGPFYTGSSLDDKQKTTTLTLSDGIERHSDKYKKVKKIGTTIDEYPYNLEFFPSELYSVMGVSSTKRKKLELSSYNSNGGIKQYEIKNSDLVPEEKHDEEEANILVEKLKDMAEDLDTKDEDISKDIDEEEGEEDVQDEFEDDEDDDYNAEKYFDDGNEEYAENDDDGEAEF